MHVHRDWRGRGVGSGLMEGSAVRAPLRSAST
ncbi:GNAT family N-acetyltransferase [Ralstonia solanacearum]|nr:GNAT family N-acetyltransferase [Ralstonia solanacearum]